jgi:hypothetical protein
MVGAPGSGLNLVIGRARYLLNPATGLFEPAGPSVGRVIDLCALLA